MYGKARSNIHDRVNSDHNFLIIISSFFNYKKSTPFISIIENYKYLRPLHLRLLYQVASSNSNDTEKAVFAWEILLSPSGDFRSETLRIISSVSTFVVAGLLVKEFFTRLEAIPSIGRHIDGVLVKVMSSVLLVFYSQMNGVAKRVRMFHSRPGRIYRRYRGSFGLGRKWNYSLDNSEMENRFHFSMGGKIGSRIKI